MDKRPGSALKQQRRDNGSRQHRGAGPGVHDQANPKRERFRDTRGPNKDKVGHFIGGLDDRFVQIQPFIPSVFHQGKRGAGDGAGDAEQKKFSGAGYNINLVESLERDIVSRNPNVHWYGGLYILSLGGSWWGGSFLSSD